jgi:hypothetical protein
MTATLMDTAVWGFALATAWSAAVASAASPGSWPRGLALGLAASLLAVTRPEGPLVCAILLGAAAAQAAAGGRGIRAGLRALAGPAAMAATAVLATHVARRAYFGWWLPNTYYAKVDAALSYRLGEGLAYLDAFAQAFPVACAAFAAAALTALAGARAGASMLALALVAAGALNVAFVGGDHFGSWRVLQPYWILALVPVAGVVARFTTVQSRPAWVAGSAAAIAAGTLVLGIADWRHLRETTGLRASFDLVAAGRAVATSFNGIFPPDARPVVGVVAGGAFPLVYEGRSFDLLGLNDVEMAHASATRRAIMHGHGAFHAPTFFRRAPELLIGLMRLAPVAEPAPPEERVPVATLDAEATRTFDATYAPVAIATPSSLAYGAMLPAWARRDWLAKAGTRFPMRELVRAGGAWTFR